MAQRLLQGAAVPMVTADGVRVRRLLLGANWASSSVDVDMCALLLRQDGGGFRAVDENGFLFRRRRTTPERSAFLTFQPPGHSEGPDRAQIILDFDALSPEVTRIVVAMSALRREGTLAEMGSLQTRAMDLATGETMYVYKHQSMASLAVQCLQLWTLKREGTTWEGRLVATEYPGGPPALVRDFGARAT
ncbi:TerD family protein [Tessaracoccus defluvii]|uniref:TerD family protein n=1 Tax=Tessaracoccus defluvii TaxID=1285901 RepID=A0A7H0H4Q6_9ACTN|nr:TerD family protein [Tessaracoccus defluvii]QNP55522.1 TerD family protein [Tessaracoccus defluvii]